MEASGKRTRVMLIHFPPCSLALKTHVCPTAHFDHSAGDMRLKHNKSQTSTNRDDWSFARIACDVLASMVLAVTIGADDNKETCGHQNNISAPPPQTGKATCRFLVPARTAETLKATRADALWSPLFGNASRSCVSEPTKQNRGPDGVMTCSMHCMTQVFGEHSDLAVSVSFVVSENNAGRPSQCRTLVSPVN